MSWIQDLEDLPENPGTTLVNRAVLGRQTSIATKSHRKLPSTKQPRMAAFPTQPGQPGKPSPQPPSSPFRAPGKPAPAAPKQDPAAPKPAPTTPPPTKR